MNAQQLWTNAANLRKESAELLRKAQWQAGCMANEGHSSEEIDRATAGKMARMAEIDVEISAAMTAWAAA
jgi:hypothetical protein